MSAQRFAAILGRFMILSKKTTCNCRGSWIEVVNCSKVLSGLYSSLSGSRNGSRIEVKGGESESRLEGLGGNGGQRHPLDPLKIKH